jgi:hypothetical protein
VAVTHESQAKRELRAFSSRRKFRSFLVNDQNLRLARRSLRPARPEVARAASGDVTIGPFQGAVFWEHAGMSGNSLWKRSGSGQVRSLRGECMVRDFWGFCRSSWNDKISSLQTTTSAALVCEHDNFQGVCAYVAPHLNASWITTPNMPFGFWNDRISSLCMY